MCGVLPKRHTGGMNSYIPSVMPAFRKMDIDIIAKRNKEVEEPVNTKAGKPPACYTGHSGLIGTKYRGHFLLSQFPRFNKVRNFTRNRVF